jgi:RNA polymerase sigma factor (sigma-70 family)
LLVRTPDELWPDAIKNAIVEDVELVAKISEIEVPQDLYKDQDTCVLETELSSSIESILKTLTPREEKIIRMRMGFAPYYETHTLHAIAENNNVTVERIRQIESKALRKLREPRRSRNLQELL